MGCCLGLTEGLIGASSVTLVLIAVAFFKKKVQTSQPTTVTSSSVQKESWTIKVTYTVRGPSRDIQSIYKELYNIPSDKTIEELLREDLEFCGLLSETSTLLVNEKPFNGLVTIAELRKVEEFRVNKRLRSKENFVYRELDIVKKTIK